MPSRTVGVYYDNAAHPGDKNRVVDARGNTTVATYDAQGDVASMTDPQGDKTEYGYNTGTGWMTSQVAPDGVAAGVTPGCTPPAKGCTTYAYDAWGNPTKTTDALGHTTKAAFDADGDQTSATDGNSQTTSYTFDPAGQQTAVTAADNSATSAAYYPDGTIEYTADAAGHKTSYTYDSQGRKTSRTDPDQRTTSYTYDANGNLATSTDPGDQVTTYGYDAADQPDSVQYSGTSTPGVTVQYDPDGWKTSMTDGTGTTTWSYDAFGEITSQTNGAGSTVSYAYDANGNQTGITYPGASTQTVTQVFDKANRPTSVTDWNQQATTFGYDADSNLMTTTYPNGNVVTNTFDDTDSVSATKVAKGSTVLASLAYTRDAADQVAGLTPTGLPGGPETYGYTALEQLKSTTSGSTTTSYAYDAARNPTEDAGSGQGFDAADQLCWTLPNGTSTANCSAAPVGATTYGYNAQGDRTAATPVTGTASSYSYNQANELTGYTGSGGTAGYTYDGQGLRASKQVGATLSTFTWDDAPLPDLLTDGPTSYVYGPGGVPIEQIDGSTTQWYFHDVLGSTRALLDSGGAIAGAYGYDPYGRLTGHTGTATTPIEYAGAYTDAETGFVYLRARYYDPATAQFITVDPAVDATQSAYTYGSDDPLNEEDPSGWCAIEMGKGGGGYRSGSQSGAQLTKEEQDAVNAKEAGEPYDQKAFNRAQQKIKQAQKFAGERNQQKRKGNSKNKGKSNFSSSIQSGVEIAAIAVAAVAVVALVVISLPFDAIAAGAAAVSAAIVGAFSWAFSW